MTTLAEHNAALRKAGLPTIETLTRRILAVFSRATSADIESGATWYNDAQSLAIELGDKTGEGLEAAAAVISHLSPRTTWTRNVSGAIALLLRDEKANGIIQANFDRARDSLRYNDPEESFGGPKTLRFFRNITGDTEAVTVDVWAAKVAGVDELLLRRVGVYDAVEVAYQRAARVEGVEPSTMQATTWIVVRNGRAK